MRWFWSILLLIALLTAGLFGAAAFRQHRAARDAAARAHAALAEAKAHELAAAVAASKREQAAPTPKEQPPAAPKPADAASANPTPLQTPGTTAAPALHTPKSATITPSAADSATAPKPSPKAKPLPPLVSPTLAPAKIAEYDVMGAALIERTEEGLAFGDIIIKGDGSQANPFVVPWDALVTAEDQFDPSRHSLRIPEVVAVLHDKYVRLDGYVSFPLMTTEPRELLAMLNMWDGCCIGVPPTPYDAVEVQLKKALTGDERYAVSGRVIGKFNVKPYVVRSWLVGMYVMEDAEFTPSPDDLDT